MSSSMAEVSRTALQLRAEERAELIERLFDSLDVEISPERRKEIDRRWADESERRIDAVNRGELAVTDGPSALARMRRSLAK